MVSQLQTYQRPSDRQILSYEGNQSAVHLAPGAWVRHGDYESTKGILVAIGDDFLTVLWSIPPKGMTTFEEIVAILRRPAAMNGGKP